MILWNNGSHSGARLRSSLCQSELYPSFEGAPVNRSIKCSSGVELLEKRLCFSYVSQIADNVFPIGVYSQPSSSISTWQSRGVNTMVTYESQGGAVSPYAWSKAVESAGMYQIRSPLSNSSTDMATDAADSKLLAWQQPDEPEANNVSPATLASNYNTWKATPNAKPVFTNFAGGDVLGLTGPVSGTDYQAKYLPYTDVASNDFYPVTGWNQPGWINYDTTGAHETEGMAVDRLAQLSNNKPQWSIIESSDQNLSWTPSTTRGVYPQEFRGEFWDSVIHGSSGVVYFPQQFNGFKYDATPQNVVDEMVRESNWINGTDYGTLTKGAVASVLHLASNPTDPALQMKISDSRLEGVARTAADGSNQYFIVLDRSWNGQTPSPTNYTTKSYRIDLPNTIAAGTTITVLPDPKISVVKVKGATSTATSAGSYRTLVAQKDSAGNSYIMDSFAPFASHIYRLGTLVTPATTVAQPSDPTAYTLPFNNWPSTAPVGPCKPSWLADAAVDVFRADKP